MDVRCEKCNTEYELDEARLKPGGVTVKCTTCGHMFKIRKRSTTQSGPAVRSPTNAPPMAPPPKSGGTPVKGVPLPPMSPRAQTGSGPVTAGEGERNWIIRLDNGETRACRELGILQQWIITGLVSRESMISRSGKTWKRLGDIAELASFFVVAEEARDQRVQRESGRITPPRGTAPAPVAAKPAPPPSFERETVVEPMRGPGTGRTAVPPPAPVRTATATPAPPAPPGAAMRSTVMGPAVAAPRAAAITPPPPPVTAPASPPPPPPRAGGLAGAPTLLAPLPAPPATPLPFAAPTVVASPTAPTMEGPPPAAIPPPSERSTGAWATEDVKPIDDDGVGPRRGAVRATGGGNDSFGGVVRPVPTDDAAFVGGLGAGMRNDDAGRSRRDEPLEDDAFLDEPRRRGPGLWIALGSLVVIAAAAGVVYFAVLRPAPSSGGNNATGDAGLVAAADGGMAIDGGTTAALTVDAASSAAEDLLDQGRMQLGRDVSASLIAAEKLLADGGRNDAEGLALRARLVSAQVQILEDEAELARDAKTAEKVKREAKQLVLTALGLAQRAIKAGGNNALANVAMADVLRLQGKPMKDLRRYLDTARAAAPDEKEAGLVEALALIRDKDYDKADGILRKLDQGALEGTGDVRPRWHLARIAFARKLNDEARGAADAVMAAQPEHAGARAMIAKLGAVAVDPLPTEDIDAGTAIVKAPVDAGTGPGPGPGTGAATPTGNDYDKLLAKANKLAEVDCGQAMPYYSRALEVQPNGVDALTGMGFCHIDAKQFASAHSKFRAALGISPRNERALWGVAEAYQQQGRTDLAITAYEKYLENFPGSAAAQRQLDRLKGKATGPTAPETGSGGSGGTAPGTGDPPPDKPPEKPPEPTPEPGPSTDPSSTP